MKLLRIEPADPVMTRDGRPFDDTPGAIAHIMDQVSPSVVAGSIRTLAAKSWKGGSLEKGQLQGLPVGSRERLKSLKVSGPLLEWNNRVYYPLPRDLYIYEDYNCSGRIKAHKLSPQPLNPGEGCFGVKIEDRRVMEGLKPVKFPDNGKPYGGSPDYVCQDWLYLWMNLDEGNMAAELERWECELNRWKEWLGSASHGPAPEESPFLQPYKREARVHNAVDPEKGTVLDGRLFSTEGLRFYPGVTLLVRVDEADGEQGGGGRIDELHSMGGKRRLASFRELGQQIPRAVNAAKPLKARKAGGTATAARQAETLSVSEIIHSPWNCPREIAKALRKATKDDLLRMTLATPAYFHKGWRPRWIGADLLTTDELGKMLTGEDNPKLPPLKLKLVWACVDCWQPVSGWSYARSKQEGREKPVRRMAPAGSVYFFELVEGNAGILADYWLASVSDTSRRKGPLDKEDGFGLALWGVERLSGRGADKDEQER